MILKDIFLSAIERVGSCWIWRGRKSSTGYGRISFIDQSLEAHRVAYELFKEAIPEGKFVLHSCDTPACVNPDHLRVGAPKDDVQDMLKKHERFRGERIELVKELRINKDNLTVPELAERYGLGLSSVYAIMTHRSWNHVPVRANYVVYPRPKPPPNVHKRKGLSPYELIMSKCVQTSGGCLLWQGKPSSTKGGKGGQIMINGQVYNIHRYLYEWHLGESLGRKMLSHCPKDTRCVEPTHRSVYGLTGIDPKHFYP